ncbi:hypothetical protein POJ06DRAFT_142445 [Lipomyces tetrasporus]|uniref:DUF3844 domain-containing protein n=1 Tax=Lipomyces tetrasporus TaxID=54092 RepID=A0AAD7QP76_9ASCO|nr:uncharacterized protein POJ06DRAFT_142445 [Lipomyces tetrasporus]KAJ8098804.1 hypothetical protein POJ06DRAFT_142445 [Lipomyces tetrasporus]
MLLQPIATVAASVVAALFAAPAVDAAAHPAAVFAFPKSGSSHQSDIPSLRPAEARLVFAERLGVSRFHKLGFQGQDMKVLELDRFSGEHTGLWRDQNENVVVVVSGVSNTKDAFTESRPAFFINDTPDAESFRSLATGFIREAQQLVGDLSVRVFGNSLGSFISVVPDMDLCINGHEEVISRAQCINSDLDLNADFKETFGEFAEVFDAESSVDAAFMDEALAFNSFINNFAQSVKSDSQLAVLFFNSLNSVLVQYGADSVKYNVASALVNKLLQQLVLETAPSTPITAVLLPGGAQTASSKKAKRGANTEAFGNQHVSPAVSVGILAETPSYTTQEECEVMTNFCSGGHGICMQMYGQEGFYGCSCISTYDETTRQRTFWAGDYCQKTDVTVPFQIFFWFLIISILFLAWTIKAMMSIGSEELPAVLAAATMVQTKA